MDGYDVAQICRQGHVITTVAERFPDGRKSFCDKCGSPTIMACEKCAEPIRGYYHASGFLSTSLDIDLPMYCHGCGTPYPWRASGATRSKGA